MNPRWLYFQVHGRMPKRKAPRKRAAGRGPARNPKYRAWIRSMPCVYCGSTYRVEAAHTGDDGGTSQKASDYSCIPACWECHTAAPHSHHRDRAAFEVRLLERTGMTVPNLVRELNQQWRSGREQAA